MFSDSHCHIDFQVFDKDRTQILENCLKQNINKIIVPSVKSENWHSTLELCFSLNSQFTIHNSQLLCPCLGLHPIFLIDHCEDDLNLLENYCREGKIFAMGEIGLDYYLKDLDKQQQLFYFKAQLELAKKYSLAVLIHARKSHHDIIQLLKEYQPLKGIIHAFNGSIEQAQEYIKLGFKLGFGGAFTYPRAKHLRRLAIQLPLQSMVLETDAPDMMPLNSLDINNPQRNTPENIISIFKELVTLRKESEVEIEQQLEKNINVIMFPFQLKQ